MKGTNLGGTGATVTVANMKAYVYSFNGSNTSLQLELPVNAPLGPTTLTVGASAPFNITLIQYAPGIGTNGGTGSNLMFAYHYSSGAAVTPAYPAAPNEQIAFSATGLGPTNPVYATGTSPSDNSAVPVTLPTVTVGGKAATGVSAFLAPNSPGFFEVILTVPASLTTGAQNLTLSIGGESSETLPLQVSTAPIITGIGNAASNILGNFPVAQGAIFVIYGTAMGPASTSVASSPFQSTSLSGTSVSVTVGGTTVNALMYYTSATQVAGLLPSNTPTGAGTWTVTYNGQTSATISHAVAADALGIFTIDSSGQGAGIVTYADYSLVSPVKAANCGGPNTTCGAANPGDTLILWATGLGPVNGNDASGAGLGQNMANIPVTVWLGGVQAPVSYQGRSGCCIGEDQIVFTVPSGVPLGCAVPLAVQIGTAVSNTALMAVANGTRSCTPVNAAIAGGNFAALEELVASGSPLNIAALNFRKSVNDLGTGYVDTANFEFFKISAFVPGTQAFLLSFVDDPPSGTCVVYSNPNDNSDTPFASAVDLNAGPNFTVTGAAGSATVTPSSLSGNGSGPHTTLSAAGSFLVPGNFTVTGPGGADIGAFTANFTLAAAPITPVGPANNSTVTRANGMTVTWSPGAGASGNIQIQVVSATDSTFTKGFTTQCSAPASAGSFTIPAYALLPHLISGGSSVANYQLFSIQEFAFTAPGANLGLIQVQSSGPSPSLVLQ